MLTDNIYVEDKVIGSFVFSTSLVFLWMELMSNSATSSIVLWGVPCKSFTSEFKKRIINGQVFIQINLQVWTKTIKKKEDKET